MSFYDDQIKPLEFDPEKETAKINYHPDEPMGKKQDHPLLWENKKGDLCIGIIDLYTGEFLTYDTKSSTSRIDIQPLHLKRLAKPDGDNKYKPCEAGHGAWLYFPKLIVDAYLKGKEIDTLILPEGFKKAYYAAKKGIPAVGMPGIHQLAEKMSKKSAKLSDKKLKSQLIDVIEKCKVKNLVFLTDADTLNIEWREDKDLYKRPYSFCKAITNFMDLTIDLKTSPNVYFMHIKKEFLNDSKGLDDLLINNRRKRSQIKKELLYISKDKEFFDVINASNTSFYQMKEYFGIQHFDNPKEFYNRYRNSIGTRKFIYNHKRYQYNIDSDSIDMLQEEFVSPYLMILDKFFVYSPKPTNQGRNTEMVLQNIKESGINIKLGNSKNKMETLKNQIDYYDGAICLPSHTDFKYYLSTTNAQGHEFRYYNKYHQLSWTPKQGEIEHSLSMIKHIFGEHEIEYNGSKIKAYDIGLDYMQLLYTRPTQKLPIVALVSEERETGKTTFWDWCRAIFQQNVITIHSDELSKTFTDYFAGKLLVVIEEALVENRKISEKIKEMTTAKTMKMEEKNVSPHEIENFVKLGLSSNNIDSFAKIDEEENRYYVLIVKKFKKQIVNFLDKLIAEIPAFLAYLIERELVTAEKNRMWFDPILLENEALKAVKKKSRWGITLDLEDYLKETISAAKTPVLKLSSTVILDQLDNNKYNRSFVNQAIKRDFKKDQYRNTSAKFKYPVIGAGGVVRWDEGNSRYYKFYVTELYEPDDYFQFLDPQSIIDLEEELLKDNGTVLYSDDTIEYLKHHVPDFVNKIMTLEGVSTFKEAYAKLGVTDLDYNQASLF